jgi:KipI family sensor histidine kinase inhibitor
MRPVGDHAALWELPGNASVHVAARRAREQLGDQLIEIVPGHETLLVVWGDVEDLPALMSNLKALASDASAFKLDTRATGMKPLPGLTVPVRYDGADLERVARGLGVSEEGVVELHSGAEYVVGFIGSAGLPYLFHDGGEELERLVRLPRLATPRTAVPPGSVAVAAGYCCVYPRRSPGGWNLLGRTDVVLFDAERDPPALLEAGMRVRFEPVR